MAKSNTDHHLFRTVLHHRGGCLHLISLRVPCPVLFAHSVLRGAVLRAHIALRPGTAGSARRSRRPRARRRSPN
eukprot:811712-Rhodomonas_salina.2